MDLLELTKQLGFPVALAIYFIWDNRRIQKERLDDVKTVTSKAVEAINKSTESDKNVTTQLEKNNTALDRASGVLSRVEGILTTRGQQNGNRGN